MDINILRHSSFKQRICKKVDDYAIDHHFVCLFVWSFSSHSRMFHSFGDVTFAGGGLQILTCARY